MRTSPTCVGLCRVPAVLVCLLIAGLGSMSAADTLLVPKEFTTIQAAVDAAVDGDTIRVSAGVYTGTGGSVVDFGGKAIILESAVAPGDPPATKRCSTFFEKILMMSSLFPTFSTLLFHLP